MSTERNVHALGRPFEIGFLYDCRTEKPVDLALADPTLLTNNIETATQPAFDVTIFSERSLARKLDTLKFDEQSKLSLALGIVATSSASIKAVMDGPESLLQSRIVLLFRYTSDTRKIQWQNILKQQKPTADALNATRATHFVSGITKGVEVAVVFEIKSANAKDFERRHQELLEVLTEFTLEENEPLYQQNAEFEKNVTCAIYGNVKLKKPRNFKEAFEICSKMRQVLSSQTEEFQPIWIQLTPLTDLDPQAQTVMEEVPQDLIETVIDCLDEIRTGRNKLNDLIVAINHSHLSWLRLDLKSIIKLLTDYSSTLKQKFTKATLSVLAGDSSGEHISEILALHDKSPYGKAGLKNYVSQKTKEIQLMDSFSKALIDITFCSNREEIDGIINDLSLKQVFSLELNQSFLADPYLKLFETGKFLGNRPTLWADHPDAVHALKHVVKGFAQFFERNRSKRGLGFFVSLNEELQNPDVPGYAFVYKNGKGIPFTVPMVPDEVKCRSVCPSSVVLEWEVPTSDEGVQNSPWSLCHYRPKEGDSAWLEVKSMTLGEVEVTGLHSDTEYEFKICEASIFGNSDWSDPISVKTTEDDGGRSQHSEEHSVEHSEEGSLNRMDMDEEPSKPIKERFMERMMRESDPYKDGKPIEFRVRLKELISDKKAKIGKYMIGNTGGFRGIDKVILLMGATGAGKSTLINAMFNYFFGVRFEDGVRFRVIIEEGESSLTQQAHSMTKSINAYTVEPMLDSPSPYALTIIDTPGFGDTGGITRDQEIIKQLKHLFLSDGPLGVDHIDAIGIVVQSSLARLTPTQRYIFDSVLSVFGKDIADNIFLMCTFADDKDPPALSAVKVAEMPYREFYQFNNCAIFASNDNPGLFTPLYWKMGVVSMEHFFNGLSQVHSKSLRLTQEVLKERERVEAAVQGLQPQIQIRLAKMEELKLLKKEVNQHGREVEANKNFQVVVDVPCTNQIKLDGGIYVTNCAECNVTCHYPCQIADDRKKADCAAMEDGKCNVCPRNCPWDKHFNYPYRWEYSIKKETKTLDEIKKMYDFAHGQKITKEQLLNKMQKHIDELTEEVSALIYALNQSLSRLDEIALRPNVLSTPEYIDLMIQSEMSERRDGYMARIEALNDARKKAELIEGARKAEIGPNPNERGQHFRNTKNSVRPPESGKYKFPTAREAYRYAKQFFSSLKNSETTGQ